MSYYKQQLSRYSFLNEVEHQKLFLTDDSTQCPSKPIVLGYSIGAGKTEISILHLDHYYSTKRNSISVIIPSSTKDLRENYVSRLNHFNKFSPLNFTYAVCATDKDFKQAIVDKVNVIIALPIALNNNLDALKKQKINWLIIDEAHEWYFAKTVQNVIDIINPKYQLLLTGTPFVFNAHKDDYIIYYVSMADLRANDVVSNFKIEVISSTYNRKQNDWISHYGNLKSSVKHTYNDDKKALNKICSEMIKKIQLPTIAKDMHLLNRISSNKLSVFGALDKTIIYCDNVRQADNFYDILNEYKQLKGKVCISTSVSDIDAEVMDEFKYNTDLRILILCDRGRKGFNMPELFNIVDFTMTFNPVVQYQMFRVTRKSKLQPNKQKMFFKVAALNNSDWVKAFMTGVLALTQNEYFESFTGNAGKLPVPRIKQNTEDSDKKPRTKSNRISAPNILDGLPIDLDFWTNVLHKQNDAFATIAYTTLDEVRKSMFEGKYVKWTLEKAQEVALLYNSRGQFASKSPSAFGAAAYNGWLDQICAHMTEGKTVWTDEMLFNAAKPYKTRLEFANGNEAAYAVCRRRNILDKVCAHMQVKKQKLTKEECAKLAKKFKYKSDFLYAHKNAYQTAHLKGWLDEICSHMEKRKPISSGMRPSGKNHWTNRLKTSPHAINKLTLNVSNEKK